MTIDTNIGSKERIRWAVFIFYFCHGLIFTSWVSRIPDIKTFLNLDDASWGTVLMMLPIGQLSGMALAGILVPRFGSKNIVLPSFILYLVALLVIGSVESKYILMLSLLLLGFFANICNIAINTQGLSVEALYGKSIMSFFHGGWSLAGFSGSLIGLLMINMRVIPFKHYVFVICFVLFLILFNYRYLQPDLLFNREPKAGVGSIFKIEKLLLLLGLLAFLTMVVESIMLDWSGLYFKDVVHVSESLIPIGFTAFMVMMTVGRFFADMIIKKWNRQRVIQGSGLLISSGLFVAVIYPHIIVTTIAFMIIGLGLSSIIPTIYSMVGQRARISPSVALTVVSFISFLGFLLGPPIVGFISHATTLRYAYALVILSSLSITVLASFMGVFKAEDQAS